ncbi:hypothetical protein MKX07_007926 [Trichoderma sp. CBMAI-0711]|nr:hypothetical protein MKX07_007926 [Trichoderma sp. CBMAI-0711]
MPSCGIFCVDNGIKFLPIVSLDVHTSIVASTSRTVLRQTFATTGRPFRNVRYAFPLYDGSSVVGFQCTIGSRTIKGVVQERDEAKQAYNAAVGRGNTAALMEQSLEASDVFVTSLGNIPRRCESVDIEVTYLGELKHDAQVDGLRFTVPTSLAQRYGQHSITGSDAVTFQGGKHIKITVDVDASSGSVIKNIQSPSHPISVSIGTLSTAASDPPSLQRAHATLAQDAVVLGSDFVLQVVATGLGDPMAVLETHPTIPNQRALMTTLVPRFNLPMEMAEVVFMCDRSGSMADGNKMGNVIEALNIFLKSLPVGVKFNICSFGSSCSFLWERSMTYDEATLDAAIRHVVGFGANLGGTEMYNPLQEIFQRRYKDLNLEVIMLTDGGIWDQKELFQLIDTHVVKSKGAIRVFTLGVGKDVSHALIEGAARAGNGFSQAVAEDEKMDKMLVRMLKGALTPHITDYSLEIKYGSRDAAPHGETADDDFVVIERVMDSLTLDISPSSDTTSEPPQPMSLFDQSVQDSDLEIPSSSNSVITKLPPVTVPQYLQAPFQIPSLFPFSRTTVYVLLSDATPDCQPKSVILKGSSTYGPVELEIPARALTEKGTTIHQLAARKAVRELEDGRGWIVHAKDRDGKLLQEQFEGQFSDMVKQEAVRLGKQYQVSGRWCSFVAIQDDDADDDARMKQNKTEADENGEDDAGGDDEDVLSKETAQQQASAHGSPSSTSHGKRKRKHVHSVEALEVELPSAQQSPVSQGADQSRNGIRYLVGVVHNRQGVLTQVATSANQPQGMSMQANMTATQQAAHQQGAQQRAGQGHGISMSAPQGTNMIAAQQAQQRTFQGQGMSMSATQPRGMPMTPQMLAFLQANQQAAQQASYQPQGMSGGPYIRQTVRRRITVVQQQASSPEDVQRQLAAAEQIMRQHQATAAAAAMTEINGANDDQTANLRATLAAQRAAAVQRAASLQLHQQYQHYQQLHATQQQQYMQQGPAPLVMNHPMGVAPAPGYITYPTPNPLFGGDGNSPLLTLTTLQNFAGNWQWEARLEAVLGITEELAADRVQLPGDQSPQETDVLATLCVVVFLKKKLAAEQEIWELLVQKAEDWLERQRGADVVEWERIVEDQLFTE